MSDIALSAAVRDSLLSLQGTTNLIERTQNRLSSGLRVASPIDDPVAFFQAKGLNDRAFDFDERKDSIGQGVSTLTAALDGVEAIETLVRQLKGVAQSLKSAEESQVDDLITQFNDLRDQINNLATDSTYQGLNLINGTGQTLEVEFSEKTASLISIASVDLTVDNTTGGLNIQETNKYTGEFVVNQAEVDSDPGFLASKAALTAGSTIALTWEGPNQTYTTSDTIDFVLGSDTFTVNFGGSATRFTAGTTFDLTVTTGLDTAISAQIISTAAVKANFSLSADAITGGNVGVNAAGAFVTAITNGGSVVLDTADEFTITNQGETLTVNADIAGDVFTINGVEFTLYFGTGIDGDTFANGAAITANLLYDTADVTDDVIGLVACAANVQFTTGSTGTGLSTTGVVGGETFGNISTTGRGWAYFATASISGTAVTTSTVGLFSATAKVVEDGTFLQSADTGSALGIAATNATASLDTTAVTSAGEGVDYVRAGDTVLANSVIDDLDDALSTLRAESQNLGTNVAVLQTRLDFTESYTNTLESGAAKLNLADINEEGANLLALQTRQQLGVQALSFAGQAEQQILSLFR